MFQRCIHEESRSVVFPAGGAGLGSRFIGTN